MAVMTAVTLTFAAALNHYTQQCIKTKSVLDVSLNVMTTDDLCYEKLMI